MGKWNKNKAVGNIAENIIEMLINSMPEWKCIKFGIENHIEELRRDVRSNINSVTKKIKSMPDFIALNSKTGETQFIEVKYISSLNEKLKYQFRYKRLNEYLEYWKETKMIIIHPFAPHFVVIDLEKIREDMREPIQIQNEWFDLWNFEEIKQDIKSIFPDLGDDVLRDAIKLIPSND